MALGELDMAVRADGFLAEAEVFAGAPVRDLVRKEAMAGVSDGALFSHTARDGMGRPMQVPPMP